MAEDKSNAPIPCLHCLIIEICYAHAVEYDLNNTQVLREVVEVLATIVATLDSEKARATVITLINTSLITALPGQLAARAVYETQSPEAGLH